MSHWLTKANVASLGREAAGPGEMCWKRRPVKSSGELKEMGRGRAEKEPEKQKGWQGWETTLARQAREGLRVGKTKWCILNLENQIICLINLFTPRFICLFLR